MSNFFGLFGCLRKKEDDAKNRNGNKNTLRPEQQVKNGKV